MDVIVKKISYSVHFCKMPKMSTYCNESEVNDGLVEQST